MEKELICTEKDRVRGSGMAAEIAKCRRERELIRKKAG